MWPCRGKFRPRWPPSNSRSRRRWPKRPATSRRSTLCPRARRATETMAEQAGYEIYVVGPDGDDLPELEADGIRRAARLALEAGGAAPPGASTARGTTADPV